MNKINFTKMAGAGNDFIIIDAIKNTNYNNLAKKVCDRTSGIGADGLMVFDKSKKADYRMRIINTDGSEAEMCGNGARCMAAYIVKNKKPSKKLFSMETLAGIIMAEAQGEIATVKLSNPRDYKENISIPVAGKSIKASFINTGVPHTVIFVKNLENTDVLKLGKLIRYHKIFSPKGTNVNFIEKISSDLVAIRTYERGVEDETKACGTGSVAAAFVAYRNFNPTVTNKECAKIRVKTRSGEILKVTFDIKAGSVNNVWLNGSAKFIAKGEFYV